LSYTKFDFSDLKTDKDTYSENDIIKVSFNIKNTGDMDGKEVAQLYVSDPESSVEKATQELKGFKKVMEKSGNTENVTIFLPAKELAYYDITKKSWVVEPGVYTLKIGKSSRNIVAETTVSIE